MTAPLVFVVPLPPPGCSPNGQHGHWTTAARSRHEYRAHVMAEARVAAKRARWVTPQRVRVSLRFGTKRKKGEPGYRPQDVPNAVSAFKAGFDGCKDAGLYIDDGYKWLDLGEVTIEPSWGPGVEVRVEAL